MRRVAQISYQLLEYNYSVSSSKVYINGQYFQGDEEVNVNIYKNKTASISRTNKVQTT